MLAAGGAATVLWLTGRLAAAATVPAAGPRYPIAACDWMLLKRQKLGAIPLARECGLDVGQRGGVVVDQNCQAFDEHVYAIGECAAVGGRAYGLVGPGYAMAEVVAGPMMTPPVSLTVRFVG